MMGCAALAVLEMVHEFSTFCSICSAASRLAVDDTVTVGRFPSATAALYPFLGSHRQL